MLQETHTLAPEGAALHRRWKAYYTSYPSFARGLLIWIRAGVPFQHIDHKVDPEGQYVIVSGRLDGQDITLINIYGPNVDQSSFLERMSGVLVPYMMGSVIMGGDFTFETRSWTDHTHRSETPQSIR